MRRTPTEVLRHPGPEVTVIENTVSHRHTHTHTHTHARARAKGRLGLTLFMLGLMQRTKKGLEAPRLPIKEWRES